LTKWKRVQLFLCWLRPTYFILDSFGRICNCICSHDVVEGLDKSIDLWLGHHMCDFIYLLQGWSWTLRTKRWQLNTTWECPICTLKRLIELIMILRLHCITQSKISSQICLLLLWLLVFNRRCWIDFLVIWTLLEGAGDNSLRILIVQLLTQLFFYSLICFKALLISYLLCTVLPVFLYFIAGDQVFCWLWQTNASCECACVGYFAVARKESIWQRFFNSINCNILLLKVRLLYRGICFHGLHLHKIDFLLGTLNARWSNIS